MSSDQQTARVNVSDEDWIQFRMLAMRRRQSLAEYLGELVRGELAGPPPPRPATNGTASATRRPARPVRLSEQRLLTQLPRPEPEPPPWEE